MMKGSNCSAVFPSGRGEEDEDDVSIFSDTSSLGNMLQLPQSFLHRKSSSKPTVFTSSHPSSSPNSRLRGEANMQRLVVMAKHPQFESEYGIPPPPPPARIFKISTQSPSRSNPWANSTCTPDDLASPARTTTSSRPKKKKPLLFRPRAKSQWSAAAGSFSEAIQVMEPAVPPQSHHASSPSSPQRRKNTWGKRHHQQSRRLSSSDDNSDDDEEEERSWRWRIPGFHSPKSRLVSI